MFDIVRQPTEITFKYGDLVCGEHGSYIRHVKKNELNNKKLFRLAYVANNAWEALEMLNLTRFVLKLETVREIKRMSEYTCPYTNHVFNGLLPLAVITETPNDWFKQSAWWYDMMSDQDWNETWIQNTVRGNINLTTIEQCIIGTGYTAGTMVNDGDTSITPVMMDVSNGDTILAVTHQWHNK